MPPDIESGIAAFARGSDGGLVVTASGLTILHRGLIGTADGTKPVTCDLSIPLLRQGRRPGVLRP